MFESKRFWMISTFSLLGLNVIVIGLVLFVFFTRPDAPPKEPRGMDDPIEKLGKRLKLSDEQRELMRDSVWYNTQRLQQRTMMSLRHQLINEGRNPDFNQTKVDSLIQEIAKLHASFEQNNFRDLRKLREISTPEQRERYDKMMDRMEKGFKNRHQSKKRERRGSRDD